MARSSLLLSHKCGTLVWSLFDHWWPFYTPVQALIPPPLQHFPATFNLLPLAEKPDSCSRVLTALAPYPILIQIQILVLIHKCLNIHTNLLLQELITPESSTFTQAVQAASSSVFLAPNFAPWETEASAPLFLTYGTASPSISGFLRAWTLLVEVELNPFSIQNGLWLLIKHNKIAISATLDEKCITIKIYY